MIIPFLLFALGILCVIKGADLLVDGGASIAKRFGISNIVIGMTIIAFGTSAPEMVVNVFSAIRGVTGVSVGNIIGSNISNLLLVLGISAAVMVIIVEKKTITREIPYSVFAAVLVMLLFNIGGGLSFIDGLILLGFFVIFFIMLWKTKRKESKSKFKKFSTHKSVLFILFGSVLLFFGGKWAIDGVIGILSIFNVSQMLISATVVAVGTSLPELSASLVAVFKKNSDIAVGNIVGSNIFNILWVLGITALIRPIPFDVSWNIDIFFLIAASTFVFFLVFRIRKLVRWEGVFFILLYCAYVGFLIHRG